MRRKIGGFILLFTRADHDGRHVHIYKDGKELGVYDRINGPIRGLERHWGKSLQKAVEAFKVELDECNLR